MFGMGSLEDAKALKASWGKEKASRGKGGSRTANMRSEGNGGQSRQGRMNDAGLESFNQQGQFQQYQNPLQQGNPQQYGNSQQFGASQQYGTSQQYGRFPTGPSANVPPRQPERAPFPEPQRRNNEPSNFNRPFPPREPIQRQENIPLQQRQPVVPASSSFLQPGPRRDPRHAPSTRPHVSFVGYEEEEISQPVTQFIPEAKKADMAMSDVDEEEDTPPRYGGLSASRWNTDNVSHFGSFTMDVDDESPQQSLNEVRHEVRREVQREVQREVRHEAQRQVLHQPRTQYLRDQEIQDDPQHRGLASPGSIVTSGMVQGPGLYSSRWASEGSHY
ncbi:hypothetical protein F4805DRAFT_170507 [Annulohypoxylon moriforme]|nr:hypothetical protein F4805DRAFT_170507 [Annulohypoxylon moriforme]